MSVDLGLTPNLSPQLCFLNLINFFHNSFLLLKFVYIFYTLNYNFVICWIYILPVYASRTYLFSFSNQHFNYHFFKNMRSQIISINSLALKINNHFFLKKIYPLYSQYRLQLFLSSLTYNVTSTSWLKSYSNSKKTPPRLLKSRNKTTSVFQHPFFLINDLINFPQKRVYLPTMVRNADNLTLNTLRRGTRNLKRIEFLYRHLSMKHNQTPFQVKIGFNTSSRHKFLQTLPGPRLSSKNRTSEPVKIFETFTSLQKFYTRRYKKYNFTYNFRIITKPTTFQPTKYRTHLTFYTQVPLTPSLSRLRNVGPLRPVHRPLKRILFFRSQQKPYYNTFIQRVTSKLPILTPFTIFSPFPTFSVKDKIKLNSNLTVTPRKRFSTPFHSPVLLQTKVSQTPELSKLSSRFKIGFSLSTVLLVPSNPTINNLGTSEKVRLLEQSFSFATTLTIKKYLSLLVSQTKTLTSRGVWENLFTSNFIGISPIRKSGSSFGTPNIWSSLTPSHTASLYSTTRLTHIRFKPGYARQWRLFREEFKSTFSLPNRYQYRLTRYITMISISQRKQRQATQAITLKQGLIESKLVSDSITANSFVNSGLVFLNGHLSGNPSLYLVVNDLVQLTVSLKYYSVLKWQLTNTLKNKSLLAKMLWKRGRNWRRNNFTFPKWVLDFSTTFLDTPLYLEVDYFSLSFYVINDTATSITSKYPRVLPSYNWKYIV